MQKTPEAGFFPKQLFLPVGCFGLLSVLGSARAYYRVFRTFSPWDDEGYIMMSVKQFLDGHSLYDTVFSQYGPFFYLYQWLMHGVFRLAITHESVRMVSILAWASIALLCAISTYRLTRSLPLSMAALFLASKMLTSISNEPGHPQELAALLVAAALLASTFASSAERTNRSYFVLGCLAAAALFTKINIGVFLAVSLTSSLLEHSKPGALRTCARWLCRFMTVCVPFLLMWRSLAEPWVLNLALLATLSTLSILITLDGLTREMVGYKAPIAAGSGLALILVTTALFANLRGTSWSMLWNGVFLQPLNSVGLFKVAAPVSAAAPIWGALGLIAAATVRLRILKRDAHASIFGLLKLGFAGFVFVCAFRGATAGLLSFATPFLWLFLVPSSGEAKSQTSVTRTFWCMTAALQTLLCYPVAGSQMSFATLCMVPVAVASIPNLSRISAFAETISVPRLSRRIGSAVTVIIIAALYLNDIRTERRQYAGNTLLALPGSGNLRLPAETVDHYRRISQFVKERADTLVTYPGLNSYHFWTGCPPPTSLNTTDWMALLDEAQQENIVVALAHYPKAMVIYSPQMVAFWQSGNQPPPGPLSRYIMASFVTVARVGEIELLMRPASTERPASRQQPGGERKSIDRRNSKP